MRDRSQRGDALRQFKYDADYAGPGQPPYAAQPTFFPVAAPSQVESHQATASPVHAAANVYVTGFSQRPGTTWPQHRHRYWTIKYNANSSNYDWLTVRYAQQPQPPQ